jgi:hypothetical protein
MAFGYRNHQIFNASHEASDHEIHLEHQGTFTVVADPPGRSMFRPGGVLRIFLSGPTIEGDISPAGKGNMRVVGRAGHIALESDMESWGMGWTSSKGRFLGPTREFDTSMGGPYEITFDVLEPFTSLTGQKQVLSVRHFVSGNEALLHLGQFALGGSALAVGCLLGFRLRAANRALQGTPV